MTSTAASETVSQQMIQVATAATKRFNKALKLINGAEVGGSFDAEVESSVGVEVSDSSGSGAGSFDGAGELQDGDGPQVKYPSLWARSGEAL